MNLTIKSIERIVLLGGGDLLLSLVNWCESEGVTVSVITSPRHAQEVLEYGHTLGEELNKLSVPYLATSDIGSKDSKEFLEIIILKGLVSLQRN